MRISKIVIASSFAIGIAVGVVFVTHGPDLISTSIAQETGKGELLISPTEARERNFYAPNSETLMPDEMRVIACGTGCSAFRFRRPSWTRSSLVTCTETTSATSDHCLWPGESPVVSRP